MTEKVLQWHPAFQAVLQIELLEDLKYLEFLKEYQLSEKPLQMDTLVIKRMQGAVIQKSLGKLFRTYNVIEYKRPEDYFSINDFYKVMGYACIYQSDTERIVEILPEELTISVVCGRYPRELFRHLSQTYGAGIEKAFPGIHYVTGLLFPMQVVITGKLPEKEYIWLSRLRKNLSVREDIEPLVREYKGKDKNPLYSAAMDLIIRANRHQYEEGIKMCEALRELFEDELIERERLGTERGVEKGRAVAIMEILSDLGPVPESLRNTIMEQCDSAKLSAWLKLAAKSVSMEAFVNGIS